MDEKETFTGLAKKLSKLIERTKTRRARNERELWRAFRCASAANLSKPCRKRRRFYRRTICETGRKWADVWRWAMPIAGAKFFADGVNNLKNVPENARSLVFQICTRQLVLSSSIALETFELIPKLAKEIKDDELFTDILKLASEIANRSAKHSADFLNKTPQVAESLKKFGDEKSEVSKSVIALASHFANRTGGMTADLWANLPASLEKLSAENAVRLMEKAREFLEFGGSVTFILFLPEAMFCRKPMRFLKIGAQFCRKSPNTETPF